MLKPSISIFCLLLVAGAALAQPPKEPQKTDQSAPAQAAEQASSQEAKQSAGPKTKTLSGMSVLGNQEAPTSLVIVPWKSSEMGAGIGVSKSLDTKIRPVDMDVFRRELRYYQIRSSGEQ